MIHFDWDILGVNLETFSPETTPLQPYMGETIVTPKQVELFTSLLRQEAVALETPSIKPMFPKSTIMPEKPQNARQMPANVATNAPVLENTKLSVKVFSTQMPTTQISFAQLPVTQKPIIVQTQSAQMPLNTPYITVKAPVFTPLQPMELLENLVPLEPLEVLQTTAMAPTMEDIKPSVQMPVAKMPSTQVPVAKMPLAMQTQSAQMPLNTPYITVKAPDFTPLQPMAPLEVLVPLVLSNIYHRISA